MRQHDGKEKCHVRSRPCDVCRGANAEACLIVGRHPQWRDDRRHDGPDERILRHHTPPSKTSSPKSPPPARSPATVAVALIAPLSRSAMLPATVAVATIAPLSLDAISPATVAVAR